MHGAYPTAPYDTSFDGFTIADSNHEKAVELVAKSEKDLYMLS